MRLDPHALQQATATIQAMTSEQTVRELKTLTQKSKKKSRFLEPSTWASLGGLLTTAFSVFPCLSPIAAPLASICFGAGYWLREK